ncbi:hypothetical protein NG798_14985 [Ancylothrix sp. C2]|uniref:GspE/PulE/PilB domain-containing protein n=1 Tax=Ancylothrix sp. D3o TaxID=2953691 RepID=UPI0021BB226E|nr:hypothetical protein [Ancylothrix sp. D3o]MCT7951102.1 hypothetical protein [Ancylothrix sp. D3o]
MDTNQIFKLIDTILPFEVCLYHQILPLARQERVLHLGMVDPQDTAALDYTRRLLSSLKCSLMPHTISASQHKSVLSTYLSYKDKNIKPSEPAKNVALESGVPPKTKPPVPPTFIGKSNSSLSPSLDAEKKAPSGDGRVPPPPSTKIQSHTGIQQSERSQTPPPVDTNSVPVLKIQATYISRPLQALLTLPPQQLLQELLSRVLLSGIGRLFLERQRDKGRVLWTQEGVLQSVLDDLSLPLFNALVQELKHFFSLPFLPVERPKQVEMERMYNKTHILLLLQVNPGENGEEATLQVLRGEALNFYRQQKLADLSQDALTLATQLQRKLSEIGDRFDPHLDRESLYTLPAIDQLLTAMNEQLQALEALKRSNEASKD